MNTTVEKIVNAMFAGIEHNPETDAARDELMANCQERFSDLSAGGKSDDEAIAGVVESLKGMEDVLAGYPKAQPETKPGETLYRFPAETLRGVFCRLREDDLTLESYDGTEATVLYERDDDQVLEVEMKNGLLSIVLPSLRDGWWQRLFSLSFHKGCVRVLIPRHTAIALDADSMSGDIKATDVTLAGKVNVKTTSGELRVHALGMAGSAALSSASGEVEAAMDAGEVQMKSVSGSTIYHGRCDRLTISSVSGKAVAETGAKCINIKSVSGSVKLRRTGAVPGTITAGSTSGSVKIELPGNVAARLSASTVSGHVYNDFEAMVGDTVVINASSVSGSVSLKRITQNS